MERQYSGLFEQLEATERELRREWWLNHGHDFSALYGDDGEMQCALCPADFKRDALDDIRKRTLVLRASNPANELRPGEEVRWSWPPGYSGPVAPEQSPASEPEMGCEEERDALAVLLDEALEREKALEERLGETGAA